MEIDKINRVYYGKYRDSEKQNIKSTKRVF